MAQEVDTPPEEQPRREAKRSVLSFFKELPVLILLALVIALLIKTFLVQAFFIPSASMEPTLEVGDRVLVNKLSYRFGEPQRDQVIVFQDPHGDPCDVEEGEAVPGFCDRGPLRRALDWFGELFGLPTGTTKDFIKRIVALPGETIEMREGVVYIDGEPVDFPSTPDRGPQEDTFTMEPRELADDEYYVLGDNRANSSDSRVFQAISEDSIIGRAFVVVWPPTRFSSL